MSDAAGTTSWVQYDSRGRVQQMGGPAGGYFYVYDLAGNLKQIGNTKYTYDALNRLSTVTAQVGGGFPTVAAYSYDNVGNLATVTYANGVVHTYSYDNRNRLNNLGVATGSANLFGYNYTVDAAGHRTSVTEQSGRTVNYSYDDLYRLTNETITGGAGGMNGSVTYSYDSVGNRKQKVSTLPGYPGGLSNYNANDQLATDTYDANGNTTASAGTGYVYDFENHLISANGITYVYDGDGHRISKTVNGITTSYATTDINPTGYSQVVGESYSPRMNGSESQHSYIYGLDAALELRSHYDGVGNNLTQQMYFVHDGHGSVRAITDQNGVVTDTYDYDAFGVLIHQTGTTPNTTLYSGEQFDPDLGLYFNRARYLNPSTGRFWSMDTYEGDQESPFSLHKYLYANGDPVGQSDPSGHDGLDELLTTAGNLISLAARSLVTARTVLTSAYLILGPAVPLLVERASFGLAVGATVLYLASRTPTALQQLARNVRNYEGKFPAGPGPRGTAVGRASGQNLGDDFPVFDNFDDNTGEGTQTFSTTQTSSPEALLSVIRSKVSANTADFNKAESFDGYTALRTFKSIPKSAVTSRNYLIVTPPIGNFSLSSIADRLVQLESEFGVDDILVQESESFTPYP